METTSYRVARELAEGQVTHMAPASRFHLKRLMSRTTAVVGAGVLGLGLLGAPQSATAQQLIGFQPGVGAICTGPLGVAPCAVIQAWLARQQAAVAPMSVPVPAPGLLSAGGLPGAGLLPQDGQIVAEIAQECGGEPRCMAIAWGSTEVQRCRSGVGVEGGCFGPNGEIMKVIDQVLPQNLHPDVIARNINNDLHHGAGPHNDGIGCDGWLAHRIGVHCR